MDLSTNKKKLRAGIAAMKAGKLLSNALGTSPTETPDVEGPEVKNKLGDSKKKEGEKDGGGGSEQAYTQSDQPNGGSLGDATPRTARSGSYLKSNTKQPVRLKVEPYKG